MTYFCVRCLVQYVTYRRKQNLLQLSPFKRLSVSSDTQNGSQPHLQILNKSLTLNMTHNLPDSVSHFTLYLNVEDGQNPARKHFEKTNIKAHRIKTWLSAFKQDNRVCVST